MDGKGSSDLTLRHFSYTAYSFTKRTGTLNVTLADVC